MASSHSSSICASGRCALMLGVFLSLGGALSGCTSYANTAHRLHEVGKPDTRDYLLRYVEADDEGWLWSPDQANEALEAVRSSSRAVDTFVVVFVHGWHHSAQCCDGNVEGFKETLSRLHTQLVRLRQTARQSPAGSAQADDFRLIGIYVGWRGASLPGYLDYLTFWGRKKAAERTGEGDLREFLDRLNQLYRAHNEPAEDSGQRPSTFLGLVTIGHSFGGQVVLRSVSAALEQELQSRTPSTPGYLRTTLPASVVAVRRPLRGFGDLVVLVNPAVEAAAYQRARLLSQQLTYSDGQTPIMLTLSAENDYPRGKLFTLGRIVGEWLSWLPYNHNEHERESERKALGVYSANGLQITHRLEPLDEQETLKPKHVHHDPDSYCQGSGCDCQWLDWFPPVPRKTQPDSLSWDPGPPPAATRIPDLERYDFSGTSVFYNIELRSTATVTPYQPFMVASVHKAIIDGHNGIFSEPFVQFLTRYIGFIEGKEYLLMHEGRESKHSPESTLTPPAH